MPPTRGDKQLHITFNEMGHGDNVLISLPNGKMIVIDCGTMRWDRNYWASKPPVETLRLTAFRNVLADAKYLLNNKTIDLLILTHPDKDHCFELPYLFSDFSEVVDATSTPPKTVTYKGAAQASWVFYGNKFTEFGNYGVPDLLINQKRAAYIYSLTINQVESKYEQVTKHSVNGTEFTTKDITDSAKDTAEILKRSMVAATKNFVKILDGTASGDVECGVYFLAGNIAPYNNMDDKSTQANRGSIVTMIIYGDKKFLFMGDSTIQTEAFLLQKYGDLIKDVEVLHIPHHASYATSSGTDFVARVNPRHAVITAAWDVGPQLALPRGEIVERYQKGTRFLNKSNTAAAAMKKINCYKYGTVSQNVTTKTGQTLTVSQSRNILGSLDVPQQIWCTGSHGPIDFDYEKKADGTVDKV